MTPAGREAGCGVLILMTFALVALAMICGTIIWVAS
jgi:hypothetical protein